MPSPAASSPARVMRSPDDSRASDVCIMDSARARFPAAVMEATLVRMEKDIWAIRLRISSPGMSARPHGPLRRHHVVRRSRYDESQVKRVEAIISPLFLEDTKERLRMIGVPGMTIQEVRVPGPLQAGIYRGISHTTDLTGRIRMEIVVLDDMAEGVALAISTVVRRSEDGDGVIFISPVDEVIRIRTGETGDSAL